MVLKEELDTTHEQLNNIYDRRKTQLEGKPSFLYATEGYPPTIVEGIPFDREGQEQSYSVLVLAPSDFVEKWPTLSSHSLKPLSPEAGPARKVTREELVDIIQTHRLEHD